MCHLARLEEAISFKTVLLCALDAQHKGRKEREPSHASAVESQHTLDTGVHALAHPLFGVADLAGERECFGSDGFVSSAPHHHRAWYPPTCCQVALRHQLVR